MRVAQSPGEVAQGRGGVVFAAGSFDGVHLGHAALASAARRRATERGASAWALALRPHPLSVVSPGREPPLITPGALQEEALARAGFDGVLFFPFSRETAALSPSAFVAAAFAPWLDASPSRCAVVAGPNWRFGRGRAGRVGDLPALSGGAVESFEEPLLELEGAPVSSTRVREAVRAGDVALAARLLGRPYRVRERVLPGRSRGVGSALGAPTANIAPVSPLMPPPGVYALDVVVRSVSGESRAPRAPVAADPCAGTIRAVADYGVRPTFPGAAPDAPVLEVHLLDWDGPPLYGAQLDIDFLARLRDERRFASPEALAAQIRADVLQARSIQTPCHATVT